MEYEEKEDRGRLWYRKAGSVGSWKPFTEQMYVDRIRDLMEKIRNMSVQR